MNRLYCDGGIIGRNPSPYGGTAAWRRLSGETVMAWNSRIILPEETKTGLVTNNNSELIALLDGIELLPAGWKGTVYSDSRNALGWVFKGYTIDSNIPHGLMVRLNQMVARRKTDGLSYVLLQGHPTKADLAAGIGKKRGLPVSEHNVFCDEACQSLARKWLAQEGVR